MCKYKTGCCPNIPDPRDRKFKKHPLMACETNDLLDQSFDLRNDCMPPIFHQHHNSCTSQAVVASYTYQLRSLYKQIDFYDTKDFSTRFTFLTSRYLASDINEDRGVPLSEACKAAKKYGLALASHYPNEGEIDEEPDFSTWASAGLQKPEAYYFLSQDNLLIEILTSLENDVPVLVSMNADDFSDVDENGLSQDSLKWNEPHIPNHAMLIVGRLVDYDYYGEKKNVLVIRNSWGTHWGDEGYMYIPEEQAIKYGIYEAMLLFKKDFEPDDTDDNYLITKRGKMKAVPNNSLIYEDKGYSIEYFNELHKKDLDKFNKIYNPILNNYSDVYIKTSEGEWHNVDDKEIKIEFPIVYTTKYGQKYIIK